MSVWSLECSPTPRIATIPAAQGMTVDSSHVLVEVGQSRQGLYVGLTRGRRENHAWVVSAAPEESDVWAEVVDPAGAVEVLEQVLARDGQAVSAQVR